MGLVHTEGRSDRALCQHIGFVDASHYELAPNRCDADSCLERGIYSLDAASNTLLLTDDATGQTRALPFEATATASIGDGTSTQSAAVLHPLDGLVLPPVTETGQQSLLVPLLLVLSFVLSHDDSYSSPTCVMDSTCTGQVPSGYKNVCRITNGVGRCGMQAVP